MWVLSINSSLILSVKSSSRLEVVYSCTMLCMDIIDFIWYSFLCSTTVFSHSQTVVVCGNCQSVLCQPTGGRARLTEGCSFRKKGDWTLIYDLWCSANGIGFLVGFCHLYYWIFNIKLDDCLVLLSYVSRYSIMNCDSGYWSMCCFHWISFHVNWFLVFRSHCFLSWCLDLSMIFIHRSALLCMFCSVSLDFFGFNILVLIMNKN